MVDRVSELIAATRSTGRTALLEPEANQICAIYGIPVAPWRLAETVEAAVHHAEAIGYPVVLKVVSPEILHKSDVGGVHVDLKTPHAVRSAYHSILTTTKHHRPDASIRGLLVQKMEPPSTEVVIGLIRDPTFGPAVMFGLGGIFVEVLKDVSFRLAPITTGEAREMIHEIQAFPLLQGLRGRDPVDIDALVEILLNVARLGVERDAVDQVDLNPVFASPSGAVAVDARILLTDPGAQPPKEPPFPTP